MMSSAYFPNGASTSRPAVIRASAWSATASIASNAAARSSNWRGHAPMRRASDRSAFTAARIRATTAARASGKGASASKIARGRSG